MFGPEPDQFHQLGDPLNFLARPLCEQMNFQRFADDVSTVMRGSSDA